MKIFLVNSKLSVQALFIPLRSSFCSSISTAILRTSLFLPFDSWLFVFCFCVEKYGVLGFWLSAIDDRVIGQEFLGVTSAAIGSSSWNVGCYALGEDIL